MQVSRTVLKSINAAALAGLLALSTPASAETLRWVRSADAASLDVHSRNEGTTLAFLKHLYEPLVDRAVDGSLVPLLATSWRMLPDDSRTWEFKIREGVVFHDGSPLTAEDVAFSLERARAQASGMRSFLSGVEEISAVDDHTVHVRLVGTSPIFPTNLTPILIMSKAWSQKHGSEQPQDYTAGSSNYATLNENGTGRYRLVSRDVDVLSVMEHFPDHWSDETPDITQIQYRTITDGATRLAALLSGEVDLVQDVPVQDVERLRSAANIRVVNGPENRIIYFGYDLSSENLKSSNVEGNPFLDARVREAMALATNRDAIRDVVMRGLSIPTGVPVPPFVAGWTAELDAYRQPDIVRAKELMAEAGYENGFSVQLDCPNDRYVNDEAICLALTGMLAQINIKIDLHSASRNIIFPKVQADESDFFLFGAGVPTFDSAYLFDVLYHSKEGPYGAYNGSKLKDDAIDARIEALASETDVDKRLQDLVGIWKTIKDDYLVLPIHNQTLSYAMNDRFDIAVHPEDMPNMGSLKVVK